MPLINNNISSNPRTNTSIPFGSVDVRMIAVMRCILAFSGLIIAYIDPTQPAIFSALTYSSLVVYGIWSGVLAVMAFKRDPSAPPPRDTYWGDVLFCAYLVTLTQGTNSLFFTFFLFAILSASFSRGFQEGLLVTGASVILFVLASLWFEPSAKFGLDQSLVRPIYLLTLGYMISYWGGHEMTQRRRFKMLQETNNQLNSRAGYDNTIKINLDRILSFLEAKNCLLILKRPTNPPTYLTYTTTQTAPDSNAPGASLNDISTNSDLTPSHLISEEAAQIFLSLPDNFSACYDQSPAWWKKYLPRTYPHIVDPTFKNELKSVAALLDTQCFLTVPYSQHDGTTGRVFITPQKHAATQDDVDFVAQLLTSISHIVENMHLMDELISESAKHERFRISLDIHDTTIQPYIGLKLGLDALNRRAGIDNPLSKDISDLLGMTESTIHDLRRYVSLLREDKVLAGDSLVSSIREQADRFMRFYRIDVKVNCETEIRVNSQLAGAVVQIFSEGLSNILRHTQTRNAYLSLRCEDKNLLLEIANESLDAGGQADFIPRSINARAQSLGGTSFVKRNAQGYTVVHISIPVAG